LANASRRAFRSPAPSGRFTVEQLRANGVILTCDPDDRTLRAGGHDPLSVAIGQDH
jgi:hypothetical protein